MNHRSFPRRARALGALLVAVGLAAVAVAPAGIAAPPPAVKLNPVGKPLSAAKIWKKQRQISKQAKAVKKELKMERKAGLMTRKEYRSAMTALRKDKMARQRAVLQREQAYAKLFAPAARWAKAQNKAAVRADIAIRMGSSPRAVRALYRDALKRDAARWNKALETWRAAERQFGPLVGTKRGSRELSFARMKELKPPELKPRVYDRLPLPPKAPAVQPAAAPRAGLRYDVVQTIRQSHPPTLRSIELVSGRSGGGGTYDILPVRASSTSSTAAYDSPPLPKDWYTTPPHKPDYQSPGSPLQ